MELNNLRFDKPIHPIEDKVRLLLQMKGYKDLRFKDCSDDGRILQHKYWQSIDWDDIVYVQENCEVSFSIINWEDEDTGSLTGYKMNYDKASKWTKLCIKNELATDFDVELSDKKLLDLYNHIQSLNLYCNWSSKCWERLDNAIEQYLIKNKIKYKLPKEIYKEEGSS